MTVTRIALVHAVYAAMAPITAAFAAHWPEAKLHNLMDDSLPGDLEHAGGLDQNLRGRIRTLAQLGVSAGADGVLFTCTAFAEAIEAAAQSLPVPVLKPEEAMFAAAMQSGRRIGMIATFAPAVAEMEAAFRRQAARSGVDATLKTVCVPEAMAASRAGDIGAHNAMVAAAVPRLDDCDVIMLAQFSTSTALADARLVTCRPVLSAPESAVQALRQAVGARHSANS